MLIVFKAKGCANVIMLEDNGREILRLLGKDGQADQGVVTVEQLPQAIAALRHAVASARAPVEGVSRIAEDGNTADLEAPPLVHLFQRAQPVLGLLDQALGKQTPVTWGA